MNDFTFTAKGFSDYLYWQGQDKKVLKKISRRIDEANRLVYDIDELQNIRIISCKGHYED
jgi:toxin YoeB